MLVVRLFIKSGPPGLTTIMFASPEELGSSTIGGVIIKVGALPLLCTGAVFVFFNRVCLLENKIGIKGRETLGLTAGVKFKSKPLKRFSLYIRDFKYKRQKQRTQAFKIGPASILNTANLYK